MGCAPGGWLQVVSRRCKLDAGKAKLVGIALLATDPVAGAQIFEGDITDETSIDMITSAIGGKADIVLSDMAAATTGHRQTDHLRTMALLEIALDFAEDVLTQGGTFSCQSLQRRGRWRLYDLS